MYVCSGVCRSSHAKPTQPSTYTHTHDIHTRARSNVRGWLLLSAGSESEHQNISRPHHGHHHHHQTVGQTDGRGSIHRSIIEWPEEAKATQRPTDRPTSGKGRNRVNQPTNQPTQTQAAAVGLAPFDRRPPTHPSIHSLAQARPTAHPFVVRPSCVRRHGHRCCCQSIQLLSCRGPQRAKRASLPPHTLAARVAALSVVDLNSAPISGNNPRALSITPHHTPHDHQESPRSHHRILSAADACIRAPRWVYACGACG